ncbi:DUF6221 family protein [Streptomyces hydrogenans]|uniref:DUF6221 family protein n=1 Tax=Streptomyces hydrogenans TaxID=1873719 RepID=UPI0035D72CAA
MDLVEFLHARLNEDEALIRDGVEAGESNISLLDLVDIDAKRRIIELHGPAEYEYADADVCSTCDRGGPLPYPCPTLRLLALPFARHPDYAEAWRP